MGYVFSSHHFNLQFPWVNEKTMTFDVSSWWSLQTFIADRVMKNGNFTFSISLFVSNWSNHETRNTNFNAIFFPACFRFDFFDQKKKNYHFQSDIAIANFSIYSNGNCEQMRDFGFTGNIFRWSVFILNCCQREKIIFIKLTIQSDCGFDSADTIFGYTFIAT